MLDHATPGDQLIAPGVKTASEACLSAQTAKRYHMGLREPVHRSTLADANEARDWRIYAEFAQRQIAQARRLYAGDSLDVDLSSTSMRWNSTTIDLCLSVFPWAHFRSTKAAVKMHTLLDLRGNIPSFIHISDGKLHDVHALDMLLPEPGRPCHGTDRANHAPNLAACSGHPSRQSRHRQRSNQCPPKPGSQIKRLKQWRHG